MLAIEGNDEWLVGRGYIAKHSIDSSRSGSIDPSQEVLALTAASETNTHTDDMNVNLLHHHLGLDCCRYADCSK